MSTRDWTMSSIENEMNTQLKNTFIKLGSSLLLTLCTMIAILHTPTLFNILYTRTTIFIFPILQLILVVVLSRGQAFYMNSTTLKFVLAAYSVLTGITLTPFIFIYNQISTVITAFIITIGIFVAMSLYGYTTKKQLYRLQPFLFGATIGLLIAIVLSIFIRIPLFELGISIFGALLFTVYIAYDIQMVKNMTKMALRNANSGNMQEQVMDNFSTISAFMLYIDFINLFIYILRIIGFSSSRD